MSSNDNDRHSSSDLQPGAQPSGSLANASRRRFGKSGLAASGVVATLISSPVLGGELMCKSPSGALSGNLSTHGEQPVCAGRSPGYWKTHKTWPIANREGAHFNKVFPCNANSPYNAAKLIDLLTPQPYDKHNLGMHLVAAFLNAMSDKTPFLTVERIKSMFSEWQLTGYFSPTAGVKWTAEQIVQYLKSTQA